MIAIKLIVNNVQTSRRNEVFKMLDVPKIILNHNQVLEDY